MGIILRAFDAARPSFELRSVKLLFVPKVVFNQNEEIPKHSTDKVDQEGICFALSMKWLSLSLYGQSDEQESRIARLKDWIPVAIQVQREFRKIFSNPEYNATVRILVAMQVIGGVMNIKPATTDNVRDYMTVVPGSTVDELVERLRKPGAAHLLCLVYDDGSGHAMATRARSMSFWYLTYPEIFFFDPNNCEIDYNTTGMTFLLHQMPNWPKFRQLVAVEVTKT